MKKKTSFSAEGYRADMGPLKIKRMLPNRYADRVGPFVFLDYVAPIVKEVTTRDGMGAHPHRGIATLTYILQGEVEHFDSAGHTGKIYSGGAQWMKSGNGVVHDETINYDTKTDTKLIEGFQFWINLPAKNKAERPDHMLIQAEEIPRKEFENGMGWIKVIVGNYEDLSSKIPDYSEQFLYHIRLEPGGIFSMYLKDKLEVAAFLPSRNALFNDVEFQAGEFVEFDRQAGEIESKNTSDKAIDVILFGGEVYTEPVVAEGPFVMNSMEEIAGAYRDFHAGKYGQIKSTEQLKKIK